MTTLAKRIALLRGDIPQAKFATTFGVAQNTIGRYERGESTPDADFLLALREKLGVSSEWLLTGEGPMRQGEMTEHSASGRLVTQGVIADTVTAAETGSVLDDPRLAPLLEMMEGLLKENGQLKLENLKLSMRLDTSSKMIESYQARQGKRRQDGE